MDQQWTDSAVPDSLPNVARESWHEQVLEHVVGGVLMGRYLKVTVSTDGADYGLMDFVPLGSPLDAARTALRRLLCSRVLARNALATR